MDLEKLGNLLVAALERGMVTAQQLGVSDKALDKLLNLPDSSTRTGTSPITISSDDADDLGTVIELVQGDDHKEAHSILEAIVAGKTDMHDDPRQELADAEWRLSDLATGGDGDPDEIVATIQTVLDTYDTD